MNWFLLSLLLFLFYGILKTKKVLQILQQNWYNDGNRYLKWISKNKRKVFMNFDMLFPVFLLGIIIPVKYSLILFIIFYMVAFFIFDKEKQKEQVKLKLAVTARIKRLILTSTLIYGIIITIMCLTFNEKYIWLYYLILGFIMYFEYLYIYIVTPRCAAGRC